MPVWLSALGAKILNKILAWGGQALLVYLLDLYQKAKRAAEQKKSEKKMEEVIKDPNSTVDERAKAYEDYINSGRP